MATGARMTALPSPKALLALLAADGAPEVAALLFDPAVDPRVAAAVAAVPGLPAPTAPGRLLQEQVRPQTPHHSQQGGGGRGERNHHRSRVLLRRHDALAAHRRACASVLRRGPGQLRRGGGAAGDQVRG